MTDLLLRLFVKNADDTENPRVREQIGKLSGTVGLLCNLLLCVGKLLVGTLSGSLSITADAVNNLSDAASSVVTLVGFKLAAKPADEKHPFGHARMEYFSGLAVSVLILVIGVELVKSSVDKILHPSPTAFSAAVVIVLVGSILVKLWMSLLNTKLSKRIRSSTLSAAAADSRNDVISTGAVLLSSVVSCLTGLQTDGWMGLCVALFILWSGIGIARDTISPLLGEAPDEELVHTLAKEICACEKVLGVHDLIVHDYGPGRRFASAHAEIDANEDVLTAHECIDDIEHHVKTALKVELVLHYDPIVTDDAELNGVREQVRAILSTIDPALRLHDFRMVRGTNHTNVIFDLVIPFHLIGREAEIQKTVSDGLRSGEHKYYAVISFDSDAFNDPHTEK